MHVRGTSIYLAVTFLSSTTAVLAAVPQYGQCGGKTYSGETACVAGSSCTKYNDYYSQCVPGTGNNTPAPAASSKAVSSAKPTPVPAPSTLATVATPVRVSSTPSAIVVAPSSAPAPVPSSGSGADGASCSLDARFKALGKKYFGVATDRNRLTANSNAQIIIDNFGQVTPENSMKWDATENVQGKYTLETADYLVDWATTNKKLIRGHTTVWHSQLPTWVSSITDKATLQNVMVSHINTLMKRYAGKVYAWDVINEMFEENGSFRSSVFYNVLGEDFVALAFNTARAADPAAKLYINDYNLDSAGYTKTKAFAAKVKEWVAAGVPIDGVGSQAHLANNWPIADFAAATKLICASAPECAITELDIKGAATSDYVAAVNACVDEKKCVGVTVWGVADPDSWRASSTPLLFDGSFKAKAAYNGVCAALV
ncbi:endoxylanase [Ophiobolus disseminans]|uniref:Beta-xylanase n=1 Tax=Ophiobolus disseminans TaxID=1469910 RepID=A0A6A6ZKI0_9PLEO|nr:endoxylanase [Ophiobolus disseminans]